MFYASFMRKSLVSDLKKKSFYKQSLFSYRWFFFLTAYISKNLCFTLVLTDFVEFVTVIRINNQHIYSEETASQGIIRRNFGTELFGRILDFH